MKDTIRNLGLSAALSWATAWAQQAPLPDAPANAAAKPPQATAQSEAGEPRVATAPTGASKAGQKSANLKSANAADKLQLGTATVTGDREQPKVMYVVPWKKPDIGDAEGKPMNSLVDEILSPVDRDVFKREVRYYQTVKSEAGQNGASAAQQPEAQQVEK